MNRTQGLTRRAALLGLGASAAAVALPWAARAQNPGDRRYLLVVTGTGGASIIDAMLAIREGESRNAATLNTYPDNLVQSTTSARSPTRVRRCRARSSANAPPRWPCSRTPARA